MQLKMTQLFLVLGLFLSGCATRENIPIPNQFLEKPDTIVMTHVAGAEKAGYYQLGRTGILDVVINNVVTNGFQGRLEEVDGTSIINESFYDKFGNTFRQKAFQVIEDKTPLYRENLTDEDNSEKNAPYDFRFLKSKHNANYALVMNPVRFGIAREYYGFIPTSKPYGHTIIQFYLVNLVDNSIVAEYNSLDNEPIIGDWDTPPDYEKLVDACTFSLRAAISKAQAFLFRR